MADHSDRLVTFPPVEQALEDPPGLLASGGDLSSETLIAAYSHGIFPWYQRGEPLLWWSPDPRAVLLPERLHLSRSLQRTMRRKRYQLRINTAFDAVVSACAAPRKDSHDSWITTEMQHAYAKLHKLGKAHSIEVWDGKELIGGLYGVVVGSVFSAESMFYRQPDASKIALAATCALLRQWHRPLLDCQIINPHLRRLGAEEIPRTQFKRFLPAYRESAPAQSSEWNAPTSWHSEELLEQLLTKA